ncbi:hypothetical protein Tco_0617016 [Tanacetum coccineum]
MQEYTTKNPNIPKENRKHSTDKNKLTDWVLCKIYKKVPNQNVNKKLLDQEEAIVEQNHQLEDEPSPRRRRLSIDQESYQSNGPEDAQIRESNHHSGTDVQTHAPVQYMLTSNQESDLNNVHVRSSQTFPIISMNTKEVQPSSGSSNFEYDQNPSFPSSTESIRFSSGASSCSSMVLPQEEDATDHVAQLDYIMTCHAQTPVVQMDTILNPMAFSQTLMDEIFQQYFQNSYHDTPSLYEEPTMVPEVEYSSYYPNSLMGVENFLSFHPSKCISFDD